MAPRVTIRYVRNCPYARQPRREDLRHTDFRRVGARVGAEAAREAEATGSRGEHGAPLHRSGGLSPPRDVSFGAPAAKQALVTQ